MARGVLAFFVLLYGLTCGAGCATSQSGTTSARITAQAAPAAVQCHYRVIGPGEPERVIAGFGKTDHDARAAAIENARYLIELKHAQGLWLSLLSAKDKEGGEAIAAWLKGAKHVNAYPEGYRVEEGACQPIVGPEQPSARWSVTWAELTLRGNELGASIERTRRHACGRAYALARLALLERSALVAQEVRGEVLRVGLASAYDDLLACFVDDTKGHWSAEGDPSSPTEGREEWFSCAGDLKVPLIPEPLGRKAPKVPSGLASSLAGAQESAWRGYRLMRHRSALAEALDAAAYASPEQALTFVARAFDSATRDVAFSSSLEQRQTQCAPLSALASGVHWELEALLGCPPGSEEMGDGGRSPRASTVERVLAEREQMCWAQSWTELETLADALAKAAPEHKASMSYHALSKGLSCAARCASNATLSGLGPNDFGEPKGVVPWEALERSILEQDYDALMGLCPMTATEKARHMFLRDRTRFFNMLEALITKGVLRDTFQPVWSDGYWYFQPKARQH